MAKSKKNVRYTKNIKVKNYTKNTKSKKYTKNSKSKKKIQRKEKKCFKKNMKMKNKLKKMKGGATNGNNTKKQLEEDLDIYIDILKVKLKNKNFFNNIEKIKNISQCKFIYRI